MPSTSTSVGSESASTGTTEASDEQALAASNDVNGWLI